MTGGIVAMRGSKKERSPIEINTMADVLLFLATYSIGYPLQKMRALQQQRSPLQPRPFRIRRQIRWPRRQLLRMFLHLLHHQLDRLLQLRILSLHHQIGTILNHYIRLHATVLNHPFAVEIIARGLRPCDVATIHQSDVAANAAHTAPRTFANERPQLVILEKVTE